MQGSNQGVTSAEIKGGLVDASDPLSFIKNNLKSAQTPVQQVAEAAARVLTENPTVTVEIKAPPTAVLEPKLTDPVPVEVPVPNTELTPPSQPAEPQRKTKEDSFKDLRQTISSKDKRLEEVEVELGGLKEELAKYKTGEVVPEVVSQYKEEISKLERFRDLYDLESSPHYVERFIRPVELERERLQEIIEDYNIPTAEANAMIDKLVGLDNHRSINTYLSQHFDPIGGNKIAEIVGNIKSIQSQSIAAKETPKQILNTLQTDANVRDQQKRVERATKISAAANGGWMKAINSLQETKKYPELMLRGDPQHDEVVKPILENSSKEYGTLVRFLADNGLEDLPEEISTIIAKRFALSEAAAVMAESRGQMWEEYTRTVSQSRDNDRYNNPPVGMSFHRSGGNGAGSAEAQGPRSPTEAGEFLLKKMGLPIK